MNNEKKYWILFLSIIVFIFNSSCRTITHKSSADEIIDVSARKIYQFLMENSKFLENKKIIVIPFGIDSGNNRMKIPVFGVYLSKSITGLVGSGNNFLIAEYSLYSNNEERKKEWDFLLMGEIQVRDLTIEIIAKIVNRESYIHRSKSFLMPLNKSVWKYLNDCEPSPCFPDREFAE